MSEEGMEGWGYRPSLIKWEDGRKEEQRRRVRGRSHRGGAIGGTTEREKQKYTLYIFTSACIS